MNRLTSGPSGSYTYGDSSHPDAATSIGSAYTAAYDAVGNMTCRAPTASQTCAGTPTGATLTYDNEGRLGTWQNTPSSPTTTDSFLYDGEGQRIEQVVQQSGVGETDTVYVGGLEEVTTTTPTGGQPTTSTTAYYGGIALSVNGTLSFLGHDGLGTATVALNTSGQVSASRLYTPYGQSRYTNGTFPTEFGFTSYRADSITGLNYANARYYDPLAGQFVSADTTLKGGLNRYAYVTDSPETLTDPTGYWPSWGNVNWKKIGLETAVWIYKVGNALWNLVSPGGERIPETVWQPIPPASTSASQGNTPTTGENPTDTGTWVVHPDGHGEWVPGAVPSAAPPQVKAPAPSGPSDPNVGSRPTDAARVDPGRKTNAPGPGTQPGRPHPEGYSRPLIPGLSNWQLLYAGFLGAALGITLAVVASTSISKPIGGTANSASSSGGSLGGRGPGGDRICAVDACG